MPLALAILDHGVLDGEADIQVTVDQNLFSATMRNYNAFLSHDISLEPIVAVNYVARYS